MSYRMPDLSPLLADWYKKFLQSGDLNEKLYDSMHYSLEAGGKRLRPLLLLLSYNVFKEAGFNIDHPALPFAAAAEMIHTYSLIHDDLPGMDNDSLRRGKPTNHIVYGEATAILAGDGLLTKAFEIFLDGRLSTLPLEHRASAAFVFMKNTGPDGMVGGQYADMAAQSEGDMPEAARLSASQLDRAPLLDYIHIHKTADLISACTESGAILAGAKPDDVGRLGLFGKSNGLAFQIADDLLDITATSEELGKNAGSDLELGKLTYPALYGIDASRRKIEELTELALSELAKYNSPAADELKELALVMAQRKR